MKTEREREREKENVCVCQSNTIYESFLKKLCPCTKYVPVFKKSSFMRFERQGMGFGEECVVLVQSNSVVGGG